MKKFVTVMLMLALTGTIGATAVFAAAPEKGSTGVAYTANAASVLIKARATQGGQIAMNEEGGEPEFDPEHPMGNAGANVAIGDTVAFSAKANEGYKFLYWIFEDTGEAYSTDATITIEASEALSLVALFDRDVERVLIVANSTQGGQIAMNEEGGEPEFDPGHPMGNAGANVAIGDTVAFKAVADEGWKFVGWMNEDTEELYSTDATIYVTAEKALNLKAMFDLDVERVLIVANSTQGGQIAMNEEGGEPEFDPEHPMGNAGANVAIGDTVAFSAKADEDWKFVGWKDAATGKILSTEETFVVTVNENMEIVAVFEPIENNNNDGENKYNSGSKNTPANTTPSNNNNTAPSNGTSTPATGDAASAAALAAVTLGSLGAAVMLSKKRKEEK